MEKLSKSPLVYVLAQVRIGAILQMAEYVPQIQERLRKEGYPLFREGEIREVRFAPEHPELTVKKAFAEGEIAVLDYDHYVELVDPFSVDDIVGRFGDLHGAVSKAFEQTVSPLALEAWK